MNSSTDILSKRHGFENPFKPDALTKKAIYFTRLGKRILDVGCGEGADSAYYAQKGFKVDALDDNKVYLKRLRAYRKDNNLSNISIHCCDAVSYKYPQNVYDAVSCLLVGCCMKRSEFETMLVSLKKAVKPKGVIIMSLRNYLDPELKEYSSTEKMIEPNTYVKKDDCCKIRYFIEKGRLREVFDSFEILYYYEGLVPDKYKEVSMHGDSYIICRRPNEVYL